MVEHMHVIGWREVNKDWGKNFKLWIWEMYSEQWWRDWEWFWFASDKINESTNVHHYMLSKGATYSCLIYNTDWFDKPVTHWWTLH